MINSEIYFKKSICSPTSVAMKMSLGNIHYLTLEYRDKTVYLVPARSTYKNNIYFAAWVSLQQWNLHIEHNKHDWCFKVRYFKWMTMYYNVVFFIK